jgi:hypothetical protein
LGNNQTKNKGEDMSKNLLLRSVKIIFVVCFLASGIYVNAECSAWTNRATDDGGFLRNKYLSDFSNNCLLSSGNGLLYCYWPDDDGACLGGVSERKWQGAPGTYTPFPAEPTNTAGTSSCGYKVKNPRGDVFNFPNEFDVYYDPVIDQPSEPYCQTTEVQGPYRGCADGNVQPGGNFSTDQRNKILGLNAARGKKSDLAGVTIGGYTETLADLWDDDQRADSIVRKIHYIIPQKDRQTCDCGTNSYKNAIVISKELSERLGNKPPPPAFLEAVSRARKYPCSN